MLLFVPPERQERVRQKFNRLIHVPFKFESQGSQIVFLEPEIDYSNEDLARQGLPPESFQELEEAGCFAA